MKSIENKLDGFKDKDMLKNCLDETRKNYYRPYDPGSYLYNEILKINIENKFETKFIELAYTTLSAWSMNSRGAKLQDFNKFAKSIKKYSKIFLELSKYNIIDIREPIIDEKIKELFYNLSIVGDGKPPLVTFSKIMHFYIPELVMPIDRTYTLQFFYSNTNISKNIDIQYIMFKKIHEEVCRFTKIKKLNKYKDNIWNRSIPKIIDNAIIGYMRIKNKA
jgi:hypothetical protein